MSFTQEQTRSLIGCILINMRKLLAILLFSVGHLLYAQTASKAFLVAANQSNNPVSVDSAKPLDKLSIVNASGKTITVTDGKGHAYVDTPVQPVVSFTVSGSLGKHHVVIKDKSGKVISDIVFNVDVTTSINDGGRYSEMFKLFFTSMQTDTGRVVWNGKPYRYFVPWGLDQCHTMKGLKYFYSYGAEFVDLCREAQREDGMIWSFVQTNPNMDYFMTRDAFSGYTRKIGNLYFVRQPTENHPEYIYVKTIYQCWKASGDDQWMKKNLSSASRALDYTVNDPARWSKRFGLLKRVYTIDSWDFQVEDEYLPDIGLTNTMIIDPVKSKFGVFFGDNTGYILACRELAEMYEHFGMNAEAQKFRSRAEEISKRLDDLAWNGKFYTHFIDEDPTVKRNLGVDEKSQLAQSNAYTLNRGLSHDKSKAIIESYLDLKNHLPVGSPGEWYAIYPPFGRGFDIHGAKWQYMNGGVGGHVAGELSRGAFENGYEKYATDILERLFELGKKYNNKIYFAYTGSIPAPPEPPVFKPLNISSFANMDTWNRGDANPMSWMTSKRPGDDLKNLPTGEQTFADIKFTVIDPNKNNHKAVVAVSKRKGFPASVEIPVNDKAGAVYLLHTSSKPTSEGVAGAVSLIYSDGTKATRYMIMGKQLTYWWFSDLKTDHSGIAWYGSNDVSKGIGLSWCAIDNPNPEKTISKIVLHSAEDETIYTVFGISLSDKKHFVPVSGPSFGGPDNWAAATAMAALVEGLAGVKDGSLSEAYSHPRIAPRWNETKADAVNVSIRYAASTGYVSYQYLKTSPQQIELLVATGGDKADLHLLLPGKSTSPKSVSVDGASAQYKMNTIEDSNYVDLTIDGGAAKRIVVSY